MLCKCGHDYEQHEGLTGGMCLVSRCECLEFDELETSCATEALPARSEP